MGGVSLVDFVCMRLSHIPDPAVLRGKKIIGEKHLNIVEEGIVRMDDIP